METERPSYADFTVPRRPSVFDAPLDLPEGVFAGADDGHRVPRQHDGEKRGGCQGVAYLTAAVLSFCPPGGSLGGIEAGTRLAGHNMTRMMLSSTQERVTTSAQALRSLEDRFGLGGGYYGDTEGWTGLTSIWHLFQIGQAYHIAALSSENSGDSEERLHVLLRAADAYWSAQPQEYLAGYDPDVVSMVTLRTEPERFVDDNLWMGLLLMDMYDKTGERTYYERAAQVMDMATSQWDANKGGIYWKTQFPSEQNRDKALVSNMPAVALATRLYTASCKDVCAPEYATWAEKIFAWADATLFDPQSGVYFDKLETDGAIDQTVYTYGQGMAIEALRGLHTIDSGKYPVQLAVDVASRSMRAFRVMRNYGTAKFDAIYLRALMKLAGHLNDPRFTQDVVDAQNRILVALPFYPPNVVQSAAGVTVLALVELPVERWKEL